MISLSELTLIEQDMTPGEWTAKGYTIGPRVAFCHGFQDGAEDLLDTGLSNAIGICAARNAMPVLLEIARAALDRKLAWDRDDFEGIRHANDKLNAALDKVRP